MPAERLSMRKIYKILMLNYGHGLSNREVALIVSVSRSTVADYPLRAQAADLSWPLPDGLDETELEKLLFPSASPEKQPSRPQTRLGRSATRVAPQGRNPGAALAGVQKKAYRGVQYSWFSQQYERWRGTVDPVMCQEHRAGEKLFVDYSGQTMQVLDGKTGEIRRAEIFVATLGASNLTIIWARVKPAPNLI
jgi:transposase